MNKKAYDYYKGDFTAIVVAKNGSMLEWHNFSDLDFHQIQISQVIPLPNFDPEEHRAGLHLYRPSLIVGRKKWSQKINPFINQGFVLFPHSADQIYSGKIYHVIFRKFLIPENGERLRTLSPGNFLLQEDGRV